MGFGFINHSHILGTQRPGHRNLAGCSPDSIYGTKRYGLLTNLWVRIEEYNFQVWENSGYQRHMIFCCLITCPKLYLGPILRNWLAQLNAFTWFQEKKQKYMYTQKCMLPTTEHIMTEISQMCLHVLHF